MKYFERILNRLEFNFVPIFSVDDNSILGYKIIKDFAPVGFNDKEFMYQLAYDEGVFSNFTLQLLKKACEQAMEKGLSDKYMFYTLRVNLIDEPFDFFNSINKIVTELNLDREKIVFDIKGIEDWEVFHKNFSQLFKYKLILKEDINTSFTTSSIFRSKAHFIEPRTVDTLAFIRNNPAISTPLLFNLRYEENISFNILKSLGVKYYYNY